MARNLLLSRSSKNSPPAMPLYQTPRSPNRQTRGVQVGRVSRALGQPLMPHQQLIADVAGELLPNGLPAFREIVVTIMRQQGKTTLLLAHAVERCTLRGKVQKVAYTAQTGSDARKKLLDDQLPILDASPFAGQFRPSRANDNVAVVWRNGSRIDVIASSPASGHGKVVDLAQLDEAFDDTDDRREQALLPAQITRPDAQLMIVSAMGTDSSVYLNRKVEVGRAAALEGRTSGIAYFEYAIPVDEDIDDPQVWWRYIPALGRTIREADLSHARLTMTDSEFRRAFGNQRTRAAERVIPEVTWRLVQTTEFSPGNPLMFGVEVSPDRDWAAITSCGQGGGRPVVELVDYRPGTGWVSARLAQLTAHHGGRAALDIRGPAGALITDLHVAGVAVDELSPADTTQAAGQFYDLVADGGVWVRSDERFETALSAAAKQPVGDAWRFGRKVGGDVCPLNAACVAVWAHRHRKPKARYIDLNAVLAAAEAKENA